MKEKNGRKLKDKIKKNQDIMDGTRGRVIGFI